MKIIFSTLCLFIAVALSTVSCSNDDNEAASSLANIYDFKIAIPNVEAADITYKLRTAIVVSVPYGTDLTAVIPTISVSEQGTIAPASGEVLSFVDGEAKTFTVTAQDGTTKTYTVTINVRGEIGSGSRLKTYVEEDDLFGEITTTSYTKYTTANFVSEFTKEVNNWGDIITNTYVLIYNDENEVIEKKSVEAKESTVYTYNAAGQITTAVYSKNGVLNDTYVYNYNSVGDLSSEVRTAHTNNNTVSTKKFTIVNGNVTEEKLSIDDYIATSYDSKNNPFKGIYPSAYAAINVGIQSVNTNNPIESTYADAPGVKYIYNTDNYPISASYTYIGFANVLKTYTYYAE